MFSVDQSDRTVQTTPVIPPSTAAVDNAEQSSIASAISQDAPLVSAENTGQSGNGVTLGKLYIPIIHFILTYIIILY